MTRTHNKHVRVYANGVDISGYSRSIGSLGWMFGADADASFTDESKNILIGQSDITAGPISAFIDNDTAGLFNLANAGTLTQNVLIAIGANAAPVAGSPAFAWKFEQTSYQAEQGTGFVAVNLPLMTSYAAPLTFKKPWGFLIHANGTETAANTAVGLDDNGAATALGGIFVYQLHSSDGTVTLKVQDAATNLNASFSDLSGATSGDIDATTTPQSGMIAIGTGATVRRYIRWQLALNTATTCTFTCAFIRNNLVA